MARWDDRRSGYLFDDIMGPPYVRYFLSPPTMYGNGSTCQSPLFPAKFSRFLDLFLDSPLSFALLFLGLFLFGDPFSFNIQSAPCPNKLPRISIILIQTIACTPNLSLNSGDPPLSPPRWKKEPVQHRRSLLRSHTRYIRGRSQLPSFGQSS